MSLNDILKNDRIVNIPQVLGYRFLFKMKIMKIGHAPQFQIFPKRFMDFRGGAFCQKCRKKLRKRKGINNKFNITACQVCGKLSGKKCGV